MTKQEFISEVERIRQEYLKLCEKVRPEGGSAVYKYKTPPMTQHPRAHFEILFSELEELIEENKAMFKLLKPHFQDAIQGLLDDLFACCSAEFMKKVNVQDFKRVTGTGTGAGA